MAELTISPDVIRDALKDFAAAYEPTGAAATEVGTVVDAADGIAHLEGLPGVMANELVTFADGTSGLALNLDEHEVGVVVLGEFSGIEAGQEVRRTGEVLSVAVGDGYLGRVVDPLGNPIDGLGPVATDGRRALELQAPGVMSRKSVHEPMQTGIKAIDAMIPVGRGQRQLIIGDRQTGKTAIAIDTIINQKANWESGDAEQAGPLHLRRDRPEGLDDRLREGRARGCRCDGVHDDRRGSGIRPRRLQVPGAVHRLGHRPALDVRRQARPDHLRRPDQAGRGLPRRVAAAAPPAGPRGVPR